MNLFNYFDDNYATLRSLTPPSPPPTAIQSTSVDGSPQKSFTARYCRKEKYSTNKLEEYFKLLTEDFDTCNPIQWWVGRRSQFPRLFQLARDILCIPGSYSGYLNSCNFNLKCLSQVLLLPLKEFSLVGGTPFLSDMLDSKPTQFVRSCWSRSASILSGPKPLVSHHLHPAIPLFVTPSCS